MKEDSNSDTAALINLAKSIFVIHAKNYINKKLFENL